MVAMFREQVMTRIDISLTVTGSFCEQYGHSELCECECKCECVCECVCVCVSVSVCVSV